MAAVMLGAGRQKTDDLIEPSVGIEMNVRLGERVEKGDILAFVHHNDSGFTQTSTRIKASIEIGSEARPQPPLVIERIG